MAARECRGLYAVAGSDPAKSLPPPVPKPPVAPSAFGDLTIAPSEDKDDGPAAGSEAKAAIVHDGVEDSGMYILNDAAAKVGVGRGIRGLRFLKANR